MPSPTFAKKIKDSLAPNEQYEDFACLFDVLVKLRSPYTNNLQLSEEVVGKILCVLTPEKPQKYLRAMREFRLHFAHVVDEPKLQSEFSNCVKNAALIAEDPNNISWIPSLYFINPCQDEQGGSAKLQHWY